MKKRNHPWRQFVPNRTYKTPQELELDRAIREIENGRLDMILKIKHRKQKNGRK